MHPKLKYHLRKHLPLTAARLLWLLSRLVKTRIVGFDQVQQLGGRVNFAHWHGDDLALLPWFGKVHAALLISLSQDGEMLAQAARHLGYHVVRGSSSRGGAGGLMAMIKASREGYMGAFAVDGPQGPRHVCKPGIVRLNRKCDVPLLPVGVAASRKYTFERSWTKSFLPLPFSRQVLFFGRPLTFGTEKDEAALARGCRAVEAALHEAQRRAEEVLREW